MCSGIFLKCQYHIYSCDILQFTFFFFNEVSRTWLFKTLGIAKIMHEHLKMPIRNHFFFNFNLYDQGIN